MDAGGEPRVLPKLSHHEELPSPAGLRQTLAEDKRPPTASEVHRIATVGAGWEFFSEAEASTAHWLWLRGLELRSVRTLHKGKTPDAVAPAFDRTVEIKNLATGTASALRRQLREARRQSTRVVIDARKAQLREPEILAELAAELYRRGGDYDEILVLIDGNAAVSWP